MRDVLPGLKVLRDIRKEFGGRKEFGYRCIGNVHGKGIASKTEMVQALDKQSQSKEKFTGMFLKSAASKAVGNEVCKQVATARARKPKQS